MSTFYPRAWHQGSVFGAGPRRLLNHEQRVRFRYLLRAHRVAKRLTPLAEHVGLALVKRLSIDGQCDPGYDTIARDVGCCERTVGRAIEALKALGLLIWQRRLIRDQWRTAQTSNAYILLLPAPGNALAAAAHACGRQIGHQTRRKNIIELSNPPPTSLREQREAQQALARRRQVVEARMLNKETCLRL